MVCCSNPRTIPTRNFVGDDRGLTQGHTHFEGQCNAVMRTTVDFRFGRCKAHCWGLGCGEGIDRELKGPQKRMS